MTSLSNKLCKSDFDSKKDEVSQDEGVINKEEAMAKNEEVIDSSLGRLTKIMTRKDHLIKEDVVIVMVEDKMMDASQIRGMINLEYNVIIVISLVIVPQNVTLKRKMRKLIMVMIEKRKIIGSC